MIVKMGGYGVNASDNYIDGEKVTQFNGVEYNGKRGTRIVMKDGIEIVTDLLPYEVEKILRKPVITDDLIKSIAREFFPPEIGRYDYELATNMLLELRKRIQQE